MYVLFARSKECDKERAKEKKREIYIEREREREGVCVCMCVCMFVSVCVCVCVCVCFLRMTSVDSSLVITLGIPIPYQVVSGGFWGVSRTSRQSSFGVLTEPPPSSLGTFKLPMQ